MTGIHIGRMLHPVAAAALLAALVLSGCKKSQKAPSRPPPKVPATRVSTPAPGGDAGTLALRPITSGEEGFADVVLTIVRSEADARGTMKLTGRGLYRNQVVGLEVDVSPVGADGGTSTGVGTVTLRTLGEQSDRLVSALGELYKLPHPNAKMVPALTLASVVLEGDAQQAQRAPVTMKLLNVRPGTPVSPQAAQLDQPEQAAPEDPDYFELYLTVDPTRQALNLAEKDESYRGRVLNALVGR